MVIMNQYGIRFHAVVFFRPGHDFLLKSDSSYCDQRLQPGGPAAGAYGSSFTKAAATAAPSNSTTSTTTSCTFLHVAATATAARRRWCTRRRCSRPASAAATGGSRPLWPVASTAAPHCQETKILEYVQKVSIRGNGVS